MAMTSSKMTSSYSTPSSQTLIHAITQTLSSHGIGCLLWGEHLLHTYGSDIISSKKDYKFLLEDYNIPRALDILLENAYTPCTKQDHELGLCPLHADQEHIARRVRPRDYSLWHPFPACHVHGRHNEDEKHPLDTVIALYRKSLYLPPVSTISPLGSPLILSGRESRVRSHGQLLYGHETGPLPTEGRGGRFPAHLDGVLLPSPMYLAQALIHLGMRDCRTPGARTIWSKWLMYLRECYINHGKGLEAWDEEWLLPNMLRGIWRDAVDAQIDVVEQPRVMAGWRDAMWILAGADLDRAKEKGELSYKEAK
ncbi:hypothetical protein BDW71DRAFT_207369 [Aspergillus fruticulosus]